MTAIQDTKIEGQRTGDIRSGEGASQAPYLFVLLECHSPDSGAMRLSLRGVDEVHIGRASQRGATLSVDGGRRRLTVGLPDPLASSRHARIASASGRFVLEDLGSTNGTRIGGARVVSAPLEDGTIVQIGGTLLSFREALPTLEGTAPVLDKRVVVALSTLVPAYEAALGAFARIATSSVPVLLLGESGTGKEVLARAVHALSGRRGAFVPVNCGALPDSLVCGQLFGHQRGAFSGAVKDEPGLVRSADGGTLFLDEIGDLPGASQAALLRVLQEREVTPVGSTRPVKVDLRVVAATHRRVQKSESFRSDLYARLAGYTHELLPLRERKEDIGLLVKELLAKLGPGRRFSLAPDLGRSLFEYDWPLNVRELEQALSVAVVLAEQGTIGREHLPEPLRRALAEAIRDGASRPPSVASSDEETRGRLLASLRAHDGNLAEVARSLATSRTQVHRLLKRFAIDPSAFRGRRSP